MEEGIFLEIWVRGHTILYPRRGRSKCDDHVAFLSYLRKRYMKLSSLATTYASTPAHVLEIRALTAVINCSESGAVRLQGDGES
jgi:hypothetical protein